MESYIKLLSIIAIVSICADASGTGTTIVHRDVDSTTIRPVREDFHSSTIGIKRDIENGTRVAREESLNVTKRNIPHVHRQFLSTTAKPNRVKSSIGETTRPSRDVSTSHNVNVRAVETTTRVSRDLNVTKREDGFNHTVNVRSDETTRPSRDVSTSHIIHAREVETTTRVSRDLNVTKREDGFNHTVNVRSDETTRPSREVSTSHIIHAREVETTTRVSRDLNVTKREDGFNHTVNVRSDETTRPSRDVSTSHIIRARGVETTTRVSRDANSTKTVHKKEKATTAKPNKVKLSVDNVVTNFTNAKVRSINDSSIIKRGDDVFNSTKAAIARDASFTVTKRELFGGDLNVTKRGIETTSTRIKRAVVEPNRAQMLLFVDDNNNGGDEDTDDNGDE